MPPAGTRNKWNNNFCGDTFQLPPSLHSMDPFFSEATSGRCSSSCSEDIPPFGLNPARQMIHVNLRANRQKNIISMKAFHVKKKCEHMPSKSNKHSNVHSNRDRRICKMPNITGKRTIVVASRKMHQKYHYVLNKMVPGFLHKNWTFL